MGCVYSRGSDGGIYPASDSQLPLLNGPILALDIETTYDPTRGHTDFQRDSIVVIALNDGEHEYVVDLRGLDRVLVSDWISNHLYARQTILGHNLAFDLAFLREKYDIRYPKPETIHDTMVCEQFLTAGLDRLEVGLDDVLLRRLGVRLDKSLQTSFRDTEALTDDQLRYALDDVRFLFQIQEQQLEDIRRLRLDTIYTIEMADVAIFAEMQRKGLFYHRERLDDLLAKTTAKRDILRSSLQLELTPHVGWLRIEKEDKEKADLEEWNKLYNKSLAECELAWYGCTEDYFEGVDNLSDWEEGWLDQTINKADQLPKGLKRYVKHHMSAKPGMFRDRHPRPAKPGLNTEPIKLNSSTQVLAALSSLNIYPVDQNDKPTSSGKALAALLPLDDEYNDRIVTQMIEYRKAEKLLSSFGQTLIDRTGLDGRLHCSINQCVSTGRPSGREPNLFNMPKRADFRRCFIPADGNVFVKADYNQIELRIAADQSGDKAMIQAFVDDVDIHELTRKEVGIEDRRVAKVGNFGILYGMGGRRFRATLAEQGVKITLDAAYAFIRNWKKLRPECAAWIQAKGQSALRLGYTMTALGRYRWFDIENITEDKQRYAIQREGANHPIQGSSADITKLAMLLIDKELGGTWMKEPYGTIVMQVYDEILVECPRRNAQYVKTVVERCMNIAAETVLIDVPSKVDAIITLSWSGEDAITTP